MLNSQFSNLNQLTIVEVLKGLKGKKFSAVELTQACLDRIKRVDDKVKAFITVCTKEALEKAKEADREIKKDSKVFDKKPLMGIPFSMKDVYCTKGIETTAGSKILESYIPQYNATVYQKLLDVGGILIGKTNCDAWGHGVSTENSDYFTTHNPWNLEFVAGGSSGGCGAALASDMTLFSIGEDTGGSIRLPSSFCSTSGLKVTYGRVSRYGAIAYASSLDTVGPMAKTVEDLSLILNIIAGKDQLDATTSANQVPDYWKSLTSKVRGLSIGLPREFFGKGIDKEVKRLVLQAVEKLKENGFRTVEVTIPMLKYAIPVYYLLACSETSSNLGRYDGIRYGHNRNSFGAEAKRRIMLGTFALSAGYYDQCYLKAQKARTLVIQDYKKAFRECDCIVAPVSPKPPFKIGEKADDPLAMYLEDIYTATINTAGIPSLALPCGFSQKGLPIGMQIIGPQFSEELLFKVGHFYQERTEYHKRKPKVLLHE